MELFLLKEIDEETKMGTYIGIETGAVKKVKYSQEDLDFNLDLLKHAEHGIFLNPENENQ